MVPKPILITPASLFVPAAAIEGVESRVPVETRNHSFEGINQMLTQLCEAIERRSLPSERGSAEPHESPNRLLDYQGLAERLGLPIGTLYNMVSEKKIPHIRLGKKTVRFKVSEIDKWVQRRQVR